MKEQEEEVELVVVVVVGFRAHQPTMAAAFRIIGVACLFFLPPTPRYFTQFTSFKKNYIFFNYYKISLPILA